MIGTWWPLWQAVAQVQARRLDYATILIWGCVLIMALLVGWAVYTWYRQRLKAQQSASQAHPWTLDGLRRLRAEGLLTEVEYARLRQGVIDAAVGLGPPAEMPVEDGSPAAALPTAEPTPHPPATPSGPSETPPAAEPPPSSSQ